MRTRKLIIAALCALGASFFVRADTPASHDTAKTQALQRVEAAAAEHVRILTDLQAQLPAQANADLTKAIDAAKSGLEAAQAALNQSEEPADMTTSDTGGSTAEDMPADDQPADDQPADDQPADDQPADDQPGEDMTDSTQPTGLENARAHVAASMDKSVQTLQGVIAHVPEQAATKVQAALDRIMANREAALANLDSLIAMDHPEQPEAPAHVDRPDHPTPPEHVEAPEHPEAPEHAERPERPEKPDHPEPPGQ